MAFDNGITRENVVNGFRACGIVPFNPDAIPSEAFHPSIATENPLPQQHSSSDNPTSVPSVSQRTYTIYLALPLYLHFRTWLIPHQ